MVKSVLATLQPLVVMVRAARRPRPVPVLFASLPAHAHVARARVAPPCLPCLPLLPLLPLLPPAPVLSVPSVPPVLSSVLSVPSVLAALALSTAWHLTREVLLAGLLHHVHRHGRRNGRRGRRGQPLARTPVKMRPMQRGVHG